MLRAIFVTIIILIGFANAVRSPFYAILFYLWMAYFRPESWVWGGTLEQLGLSFYCGILVIGSAIVSGQFVVPSSRIVLLLLLFVQCCISAAASTHPNVAWSSLYLFVITLLITYVIAAVVTSTEKLRWALMVIGLSLGFEGAKQGWAQLILNPGAINENTIPFLGDNNCVAVGMLMLVPLLLALARTASSPAEKYVHRFVAAGVVYRALSTYSRGGFLACGALAGTYWLASKHKVRTLLGIALVAALVLPAMPKSFWDRMSTIDVGEDSQSAEDASALGRLHFWRVATIMAADRPLVGVGHGAYNASYNAYDDSRGDFGNARSVHSSWFGALAELGYPGLLLVLANLGGVIYACWSIRRLALSRQRPDLAEYATALQTSIVVFAVGGSFVPMQYSEMMWHFVGLSIALSRIAASELAVPVVEGAQPLSAAEAATKIRLGRRDVATSTPGYVGRFASKPKATSP